MLTDKGRSIPLPEKVDPRTCALVVIDVQNDFCHPEGLHQRMGQDLSRMPAMAARLEALVAAARRAQVFIVWVRATYEELLQGPPMAEVLAKGSGTCARYADGTWGADWFGAIRPIDVPNEVVVSKHRASAFWDTPIDVYLRSNGITTLVVAGVATSGCVESTVRDAFFRNYYVVLAGDCCGDYALERHEYALRKLGTMYGVTHDSQAVIDTWATCPHARRNWRAEEKRTRALPTLDAALAPSHSALVLVDLQNDLCHRDGALARGGADPSPNLRLLPTAATLTAAARRAGAMVVHVHTNYSDATEPPSGHGASPGGPGRQNLCRPATWGAAAVAEIAPQPGEAIVIKHRASGLIDTGLELLLRSNGIRTIVLAGTASLNGLPATALDGHMLDYQVVLPRDAMAAHAEAKPQCDAWLEVLGTGIVALTDSGTVLDRWAMTTSAQAAQ